MYFIQNFTAFYLLMAMLKKIFTFFISFASVVFAFAQQSIDRTMLYDGLLREYRIYLPEVYDGSQPASLLFNLHGYGSNNLQQFIYGDFRAIADTANVILCLPNGTADAFGSLRWNSGFETGVDDVGFISALIDSLSAEFNINPAHIYSTGMSNGGFMSYTLACELGNRIAAIASVTGTMTTFQAANCMPYRPIPVLEIHGTADETVPYDGSAEFLGIDSLIAYWTGENECPDAPAVTPLPNNNTSDGSTVERFDYYNCTAGTQVVLYKVYGGSHSWPGSIILLSGTNRDFSASTAVWNFFRQFHHPDFADLTNMPETGNNTAVQKAFPNPCAETLQIPVLQNNTQIELRNTAGTLLIHENAGIPGLNLSVQSLPAGIYFLTVRNATGVWVQRVVKM
ncbi:T9SS C-terminal target domain-containing protein [Sphingobacteriales bacterium UPWRP_1]|nr:hypothetical protein BVG80_13420 [Sphingobacteriales bacterium TSM_CSM]PSJ77824.1 T9SS C-terminal target domain-containing protein [Sphingobacteriales bacterium UPWRP_1]